MEVADEKVAQNKSELLIAVQPVALVLTALEMARQGAKLIIWDINESALAAVCSELDRAGTQKSHGYVCDISNRETVYSVAKDVLADVGPVDS